MPECPVGSNTACYKFIDDKNTKMTVTINGNDITLVNKGGKWVPDGTPSGMFNGFYRKKPIPNDNAPDNLKISAAAAAEAAAKSAVDAVENAVDTKAGDDTVTDAITAAETAINAVINEDKKKGLQMRLNDLNTRQTILNLLNTAEKAVAEAEVAKTAGAKEADLKALITAAREAIDKLPAESEPRTTLQLRLNKLNSEEGGARRKRRSNKRKPKKSAKKPKRSKKGKTRKQKK